jgi:putative transcriptional regulator
MCAMKVVAALGYDRRARKLLTPTERAAAELEMKSTSLSPRSKRKGSALGRRLVAGLSEALAHARGEIELPSYTVTVPDRVDVAKLRHRLGLSQSAFAHAFGLDVTAIHAWEQGRRRPDRTARILLAVIAKEPAAVRRALAGSSAG